MTTEPKPPIFGNWRAWYVLVIAFQLLTLLLFFMIQEYYS